MSLSSSIRKFVRRTRNQMMKMGWDSKTSARLLDLLGGVTSTPGEHTRNIQTEDKAVREREHRERFEMFTRLVRKPGGHLPSKIAKTATSVSTAPGATVAERRERGSAFVIPKGRRRQLTGTGVGLRVTPSKGLNIVI